MDWETSSPASRLSLPTAVSTDSPRGTRDVNEIAYPNRPADYHRTAHNPGNHYHNSEHYDVTNIFDVEARSNSGDETDEIDEYGNDGVAVDEDDADSAAEGAYTRRYMADNNKKAAMDYYNLAREE
ncbi:hypothetical protein PG993_013663 [Apiospora rasikravindrae]|uniref:Uncharacterized protein n=1 Tax=Apiospora rasikravindrae TaxID=990691 RepID=A0ABR1RR59_9PEZI